jgi:hypothetical protein
VEEVIETLLEGKKMNAWKTVFRSVGY